MIRPGQSAPESRSFDPASGLPGLGPLLAPLGLDLGSAPLTLAFPAALLLTLLVTPVVYTILDDIAALFTGKRGGGTPAAQEKPATEAEKPVEVHAGA